MNDKLQPDSTTDSDEDEHPAQASDDDTWVVDQALELHTLISDRGARETDEEP